MADPTNPTPAEKPAAPADTSVQELNAKIDAAQSNLAQASAKLNSSATTTAVVGVILLLFIVGYFGYGYSQIAPLTEPETLVNLASSIIDERLPEVRATLEDTVEEQAPEWAEMLSAEIKDAIPEVRQRLEDYVIEQTDKMVEELLLMSQAEFRKILQENRELLETGFKELGNDEKMSQESIAALEAALDKALQQDMQEQAGFVLDTLSMLNDKIETLSAGKMLNREQRVERRVVMIARRLLFAEADPALADQPTNQATKSAGGRTEGATDKKDDDDKKDAKKPDDDKKE